MKKLFSHISTILAVVIVCLLLLSASCSAPNNEGFAIYLTKGDISPARMPALSHVGIEDEPIIAMSDIISYNAQTHEIKLTANAYEAIVQLDVPVSGRSFVVCVDRKPIYWGAFWTPISSISFDGVTIWKPFTSQEPYVITLELGYPSSSFCGGEDARNNPEVIRTLEQAGKLIDKLLITEMDKLPLSMKGYELYSWEEDGKWHFTLITGTNRIKIWEEIISEEDYISETGWVNVHVVGIGEIKTVLGKLPNNEYVFWLPGLLSEQLQTAFNIALPPVSIVDDIKSYAEECGLDFTVSQP